MLGKMATNIWWQLIFIDISVKVIASSSRGHRVDMLCSICDNVEIEARFNKHGYKPWYRDAVLSNSWSQLCTEHIAGTHRGK